MKILTAYSEIGLKSSSVERKMLDRLKKRIREKMEYREIESKVYMEKGRLFTEVEEEKVPEAVESLTRLPGIRFVAPCIETDATTKAMKDVVLEEILGGLEPENFAVDARRNGNQSYTSEDIEDQVGQAVVDRKGWEVELDKPDLTIHIEARKDSAYIYTEKFDGIGGLPVNPEAQVVLRMKDRLDTYAGILLMKRGCNIIPVYSGKDSQKVEEGIKALKEFHPKVKLVQVEEKSWSETLNKTSNLYNAKAIGLGITAEEIEEFNPENYNKTVLKPLCGKKEKKALEEYWELIPLEA